MENGPAESAEAIVSEFQQDLSITYRNEPRPGLVYARNAAIEAFLETEATWMGSIDDDGALNHEWLDAYLSAIRDYPDCRAFAGPDPQIEIENATKFMTRPTTERRVYGQNIWTVSTANILFHRDIFSKSGLGMRFNMIFNFSGGEDTYFFKQLNDQKEIIRWVPNAISLEKVPPERGTFSVRIQRAIQSSQNLGMINLLRLGTVRGGITNIFTSIACAINFVVYGIIGAVIFVFNKRIGAYVISKSFKYGCKSLGRIKVNFSELDTRYLDPDGE